MHYFLGKMKPFFLLDDLIRLMRFNWFTLVYTDYDLELQLLLARFKEKSKSVAAAVKVHTYIL
jgi:hypothetical protein